MKYLKEILKRGFLGITIGVFINQAIFAIIALYSGLQGSLEVSLLFKQFIISIIAGFYISASTVVFSVDSWSLLKQTVIHFILMSVVYFPVSIYAEWMPEQTIGKIIFIIIYVVIYILVWIFYKLYWNMKINKLNSAIERRNEIKDKNPM